MILSGNDIQQYMKYGGLKISPTPSFQQNGVDMILEKTEEKYLGQGQFTLGVTREYIQMPNDLMAFVQLRSTYARLGFMLPPTVIDAGFCGTITLEIVKFRESLALPIGEKFAHIIFAKLSTPSKPYDGKYQNQVSITHAITMEK